MTIWMQIDEERIRLSAAGLFNVGVHLIPAVSAACLKFIILKRKSN
jgi:gustatory receptor